MSDSTLREQLDAILTSLFDIGFWCAVNDSDDTGVHHAIAAREKIEALCQEVAREARLDELKSIVGWRSDAKDAVLIRPEFRHRPLAENVDSRRQMLVIERVAELTQKPAEETEAQ